MDLDFSRCAQHNKKCIAPKQAISVHRPSYNGLSRFINGLFQSKWTRPKNTFNQACPTRHHADYIASVNISTGNIATQIKEDKGCFAYMCEPERTKMD